MRFGPTFYFVCAGGLSHEPVSPGEIRLYWPPGLILPQPGRQPPTPLKNETIRRSRLAGRLACALVACALLGLVRPVAAQGPVTIGGLAYVDYYYQLTSPDDAEEGANGFTYRRLYLTADAPISDAFSARARLEANNSSLGPRGPVPFVKDLFLRWKVGGGHALTIGVTSPPIFGVAEDVWGYRSLEKTLLDLNGVAPSRDFGVRANGPITSDEKLRYGVMVGNNSGVFPEDDKYKRVYGQLEYYPTDELVFTLATNYAAFEGEQESQVAVSGLAGYVTDTWRAGVEAFVQSEAFTMTDDLTTSGVSVFGAVQLTEQWGAVGRVDRVKRERFADPADAPVLVTRYTTFGLVALVYQPHPQVQLMPNLLVSDSDGAETASTLGRVTLSFTF